MAVPRAVAEPCASYIQVFCNLRCAHLPSCVLCCQREPLFALRPGELELATLNSGYVTASVRSTMTISFPVVRFIYDRIYSPNP